MSVCMRIWFKLNDIFNFVSLEMKEKDIVVKGRIPRSIREQVKSPRKTRKTFKNKRGIKKIILPKRTPGKTDTSVASSQKIKSAMRKTKNKTFKKVRFSLESSGIQPGKFANPTRTLMKNKTAKAKTPPSNKNRTHRRSFKIRYLEDDDETNNEPKESVPKLNLLENLKDVEDILTEDITIVHI